MKLLAGVLQLQMKNKRFCNELTSAWKVDEVSGRDNGVISLINHQKRKVLICVGYLVGAFFLKFSRIRVRKNQETDVESF